jgi:DNA-directed RNA polymerase subunit M/transcription elongation factor TFIIS
MFCPNCGQKLTGYKTDDGKVKYQCPRCRVAMYSVKKKAKTTVEIFPPNSRNVAY